MPSNVVAGNVLESDKIPHKVFPNLARSPLRYAFLKPDGQRIAEEWSPSVVQDVTDTCTSELQAAGINVSRWPSVSGEVPSLVVGALSGWFFKRLWYYWSAEGPGIPPEIAERLHATHGKEVRVEGHCGCPSPLEWRKGFAIGSYHVDTQEGLNALADALRSIYDASKDPNAQPYMGGRS